MPDEDRDTLRTVAWLDLFPWLVIARTIRLAISLRVMAFGAVAIALTLSGWTTLGWVFLEDSEVAGREMPAWMGPSEGCPWHAIIQTVPDAPALGGAGAGGTLGPSEFPIVPTSVPAWQSGDPFLGSWALLSSPLWEARRLDFTLPRLACVLLCGLWAVAVWGFFGGAISRIAAVELACEERVGWAAALRHARAKWLSYCAAPLLPLVGVAFASLPALCLGVLLREQYVGAWATALLWPAALAGGLVAAILMLGLVFGWPLMWATISAEGTDSFDALSRSYAYVFGRPLHYLFYVVVAAVLGVLGWVLVSNFAAGVVWAAYWAASWGSGAANIERLLGGEYGASGQLVAFWVGGVKLLAVGFRYGYFWAAATAIYFLLRRNVDATEMDEVFLDEDASETTGGLPPQRIDEAGAPVIDDETPDAEPDQAEASRPKPETTPPEPPADNAPPEPAPDEAPPEPTTDDAQDDPKAE